MIILRNLAVAIIAHDDKILLMQRSKTRKFAPGLWAGIGGHIEKNEMNTPEVACLREIYEETGLSKENLSDVHLKYIILRKSASEIRVQYIYIGTSSTFEVIQTDEGKLYWIDKNDLLNREMSFTTRCVLERYIKYEECVSKISVGVVDENNKAPVINWSFVEDWNSNSFV